MFLEDEVLVVFIKLWVLGWEDVGWGVGFFWGLVGGCRVRDCIRWCNFLLCWVIVGSFVWN